MPLSVSPSLLVLGQVAVRGPDGATSPVTGHAGRMLGLLVDSYPSPCSRERLEIALWGEEAPATAASAFRVHLAKLRRALEPAEATVTSRNGTLTLEVTGTRIDLQLARLLAERAYRHLREDPNPQGALDDTEVALKLFRGAPFSPFDHEQPFLDSHDRARLLQVRLEELAVDAMLATGGHEQVLGRLETMVVAEPLHEHRWGQLMVALYRAGRQADALETYQRARSTLIQLVGAEPGPELQHLERAILTQDSDLMADPSWGSRSRRPAGSASIVGRSADLDEIEGHLATSRLVTVVGATGSGTSTIVRAFASERATQSSVPILEADTIHHLTRHGDPEPDPLEGPKLAVVDLFIPPCTMGIGGLRAGLEAGWQLLVAAPAPLGVPGEVVVPLRPLTIEESSALLALRVGAEEPTPALIDIARAVGGHPLSLQLAAGWVVTLGEQATADHIADGSLSLDQGDDLPAQIALIREVLDPRADAALLALSVFRHGVDLAATGAVTGMVVDDAARALAALRDSGLITAEGGGRWRIPAALRDAVRRMAADEGVLEPAMKQRRDFLLGVLEPWGVGSYGIDGVGCVATIGPWEEELAAFANEAEVTGDLELVARLSEGRFWYWDAAGRIPEGDEWFERVLTLVDAHDDHPSAPLLLSLASLFGPSVSRIAGRSELVDRAVRRATETGASKALLLATVASTALALWSGDGEGADTHLDTITDRDRGTSGASPEGEPIDDWPFFEVMVHLYRGLAAMVRGDVAEAGRQLTTGHRRSAEMGSNFGEMVTLRVLAQVNLANGERRSALVCFRAAIARGDRCGPGHRPDHARIGEAELLVMEGDLEGARRAFEAAVVGRLAIRDHPASADCFCGIAEIAHREGRMGEAEPAFRHGLLLAWRARDRQPLVRAAVGLATLALDRGDVVDAARTIGAIGASRGMGGRPLTKRIRSARDELATRLESEDEMAADEIAAATEDGRSGGVEALVARNGVLAAMDAG